VSKLIHIDDMDQIQSDHDTFSAQANLNDEAAELQDKAYKLGLVRGIKLMESWLRENADNAKENGFNDHHDGIVDLLDEHLPEFLESVTPK